jgi:hypothetical protein
MSVPSFGGINQESRRRSLAAVFGFSAFRTDKSARPDQMHREFDDRLAPQPTVSCR